MTDPRVLITTYPLAFLHRGGGEQELLDLAAGLRQLGVKADLYGPSSLPVSKYDVVLHYSVHPTGLDFVREVKRAGKKVVLLPSLWWLGEPPDSQKQEVADFFSLSDKIVFKSQSERDNVSQHVQLKQDKVSYCPWGVDSCFGDPADPEVFKATYKLKDYILWPGIIEERKNQLTAIHALKDSPLPLVLMGDYRDRAYYDACVRSAPAHFKFLPHLPAKSEIFRSAVQNCRVFLEIPLEPPGVSALEAAVAGRPMVLSDGPWTQEIFGDSVIAVDPRSASAVHAGVQRALQQQVPAGASQKIRSVHTLPQCVEPLARTLQFRTAGAQYGYAA